MEHLRGLVTVWLEAESKPQVGLPPATRTLPPAPCPQGQPRPSLGCPGDEAELISGGHSQAARLPLRGQESLLPPSDWGKH